MRGKRLSSKLAVVVAIVTSTMFMAANATAQTETALHSFNSSGTSAAFPASSLIFDTAGNLYGTTGDGSGTNCGAGGCGTVFELSPKADGGWTGKVLHNFTANGKDGYQVYAPVIMDASGNLYGTTVQGGTYRGGTVFELLPKTGGGWTERILHNFSNSNSAKGAFPYAGLILDKAGNLYGTTYSGGNNNGTSCFYGSCGTVFELSPSAGSWTETVLYAFPPDGAGGFNPSAGLIFDAAGNLYGTADGGGAGGGGTVFKIAP